jgi:hypothetical protein
MITPEATELKAGVTLLTVDGRQIGNAIIISEVPPHPASADYLSKTGQKMWLIETDFGNQVRFCDNEIKECFTLGFETTCTRNTCLSRNSMVASVTRMATRRWKKLDKL